jgi:hypothetical protein
MMFQDYFRAKSEIMQAQAEGVKATLEENNIKGNNAEQVLASFLRNVTPSYAVYQTGVVIDSFSNETEEVDVIIYDQRFPVLEHEDARVFLAEGIITAIESKLTYQYGADGKKQMQEASDFANIVRSERRSTFQMLSPGEVTEGEEITNNPINSTLFCHTARPSDVTTIEDHLQDQVGKDMEKIQTTESSALPDRVERRDDITVYDAIELENPPINVCVLGKCYIKYDNEHNEYISYRFGHDSLVPMIAHISDMMSEQEKIQQSLEPYL